MDWLRDIRERVAEMGQDTGEQRRFGTFAGVFTPDVLTILGVIMYLRLGWVVGNAGFLGAVLIILMAQTVTICTGLSMSSITTNIRIGAGGAYSIISKSLGLEAGGSVGIPFYISQTLSASLYIIGFTEGWIRIFPQHPAMAVSAAAWLILLVISYISARFAIRVQYTIMVIIGLSLLSVVLTPSQPNPEFVLVGNFEDTGFWQVFAIFFPAVTGIMAGANMSGELQRPRRAIPLGTMSAIGVTMVIYLGLAYVTARYIPSAELRSNQMALVDHSRWAPLVLAGILAATFSSALGSMVGAPRVLQALAQQRTVPFHRFFSARAADGEPRNATIFTGGVIIAAIFMGNLNSLAAFITMFFLITYGTLNLVVFIQQSMRIISFRPTFRVPRIVPFIGAVSCFFIMFLINAAFSVVAMITIVALYLWLTRRGLENEGGDIRGGMLLALAERFSYMASRFPRHHVSWKPDFLLPVDDPRVWSGPLFFIRSIAWPSGSIFAFTVRTDQIEETETELNELLRPLREQKLPVSATVIEDADFLHGARLVIQTLKAGTFRPNTLFLTLGNDTRKDAVIEQLVAHAVRHRLGLILLHQYSRTGFGMQQDVNLWLRDESPNWHLAMLIALQLQMNWSGRINLITVTGDPEQESRLQDFLEGLNDQVRLPSTTEIFIRIGGFQEAISNAPRADINIFGLPGELCPDHLRSITQTIKTSCLFVADSGQESAVV